MMLRPIDQYFMEQPEPLKSCLEYLRACILGLDAAVVEAWRYSAPFYFYKGKRFCYLWVHKKTRQPYIGIIDGWKIEHPNLIRENRSKMKILLIDPEADLPVEMIRELLIIALSFHGYKNN